MVLDAKPLFMGLISKKTFFTSFVISLPNSVILHKNQIIMEARKVIGVICAIYAVLMAISLIVGFVNPFGQTNFVMKQVGGVVGLIVSGTVSWYMLKEEKVIPLDPTEE